MRYALRAASRGDTFYVHTETTLDLRTTVHLSVTLDPRHTLTTREAAETAAERIERRDPTLAPVTVVEVPA